MKTYNITLPNQIQYKIKGVKQEIMIRSGQTLIFESYYGCDSTEYISSNSTQRSTNNNNR